MTAPAFHPAVLAARERLAQQREKIARQHASGSPGIQVCTLLADLLDALVLDLWQAALETAGEAGENGVGEAVALVAHGGYGRRDVAPYSDVDLMLLHPPGMEKRIEPIARRLVMNVGDAGLALGFSVRTPGQACRMAADDVTVFTSLSENRHLYGSLSLFTRFADKLRGQARWRVGSLLKAIEQSRADERRPYGESVYMLTPNVKRSQGALRDIQLVRWIGFARWGQSSLTALRQAGALPEEDYRTLHQAREFLLRLRNEMHFHHGKAHDVLDRGEQVRLAQVYRYQGEQGVLPVEQFMREYFRQTGEAWHAAANFLESARPRREVWRAAGRIFAHRMDRDFLVGPIHISATRRGLERLEGDMAELLRLMELANFMDKRIDHGAWKAIRAAMADRRIDELSPEAARRFVSLLSQGARLGDLLRRLHELRLLEQIIPAVEHTRGLVQFNEFHKYTVDEHSLRAVERVTEFHDDPGPLGDAYRSIKQKHLLHLALLIHDLGKGFDEDHSEVGRRIAEDVARRLQLSEGEGEILKFLVHKHLLMSHIAFRRDIDDPSAVLQLAVEVGSPNLLQMLYVLTCADLAAVGPGVLNHWKLQLLTELYRRALPHVAGDAPDPGSRDWLPRRREEVRRLAAVRHAESPESGPWWDRQIAQLPPSYLRPESVDHVLDELNRLRTLPRREAIASGRFLADLDAVEYTVGAYEEITPGVFHKLTGALTSKGHNILSAEINTLADGLVLDRFYVQDLDFSGEPPAERIEEVCSRLVASLKDHSGKPPTFRKTWKPASEGAADFNRFPTVIRIDNATSESSTIVDVFAHDRTGLLYTIGRTLFELELSVRFAKIGTFLDQVVDVFYVTGADGRKILDDRRLEHIRDRLLEAVEQPEPAAT